MPLVRIGTPPQPPTRRLVCHLPPVSGGRGTLAGEKGVGKVPIPTTATHCGILYMYVLCATVYHTIRDAVFRDIKTTPVTPMRDVHIRDKIIKDCILLGSQLTVGMFSSRIVSCLHPWATPRLKIYVALAAWYAILLSLFSNNACLLDDVGEEKNFFFSKIGFWQAHFLSLVLLIPYFGSQMVVDRSAILYRIG